MCYAITELIREGRDAGYNEGRDTGFSEGRDVGYNKGRDDGIHVLIRTCQEFHIPPEKIQDRIMTEFGLSGAEAENYMKEIRHIPLPKGREM